jgi:glutathione S-transferase
MMKIFGDAQSGNCYKVKLLTALLGIDHEWVHVDILAGDTQSDAFRQKNPTAKIPILELADGRHLSESNAILNFLAHGSELLPADPYKFARVEQWQFFEQYSHEPYIAVARFIAKYLGLPADRKAEYEAKQEGGHKALAVMENQLNQTPYLTGNAMTTADISLYGYTHVADEGGFDLGDYPGILRWLDAIRNAPGYVSMG